MVLLIYHHVIKVFRKPYLRIFGRQLWRLRAGYAPGMRLDREDDDAIISRTSTEQGLTDVLYDTRQARDDHASAQGCYIT